MIWSKFSINCLEVPSIYVRRWHKILEVQQAPPVIHQMERLTAQPLLQLVASTCNLLCPAYLWKAQRIICVPVCTVYCSVPHHKDVMLCWLNLFPSEFVWKPGTCCCLHSLLSVRDGETSLLSCTGLVPGHSVLSLKICRFRAFERTEAVSTLFSRWPDNWTRVSKLLTSGATSLATSCSSGYCISGTDIGGIPLASFSPR